MALFLSTFVNKLDSKGRVSVPSSFRAVLSAENLTSFVAYPSYKGRAIEACEPQRLAALADRMDSSFSFFSDEQADLSEIFSSSAELYWDGEGRIVLPESLIEHSGISSQAAFVGRGNTFQIWQPEALRTVNDAARARLIANPPSIMLGAPAGKRGE